MSVPILGDLISAGIKLLDRFVPDPAAKAQAQLAMLQLQQASEFKEIDTALRAAEMQAEINKQEAGHQSLLVAGWRPAIGWVCGAIFACNYIGSPLLAWLSPLLDIPPPPRLDIGEVLPVLLGMLGLGGLRTAERIKGVLPR